MATETRSKRLRESQAETRPAFSVLPIEAGPDPIVEAFERGRRQGREEADASADEKLRLQSERLRQESAEALRHLAELESRIESECRAALNELVLATATRIARERIEAGDPIAARALADAVSELPTIESIRARLHPDDIQSVERDLAEEIDRRRIELVADDRIERGGCVVESPVGIVDAALPVAIEAVRGALDGTAEVG